MQPNDQDMADTRTARRDPAEDWKNSRSIGWLSRLPVTIVAFGCPTASDERLMALQSIVARLVGLLANLHLPRLRIPRPARASAFLRHIF